MANGLLCGQRIKDNVFRYIYTVLRWIIEPSAIVDEQQRRRVRLLSAFLILLAINTLAGATARLNIESLWPSMMATSVILVGAYVLSRTRYYRLATVLAVVIPVLPIIAMVFFSPNQANISIELPWLALPLIICSLLLSLRYTIIVAISYIIFLVLIVPFVDAPSKELGQSLGFIFMIFFLVIAIAGVRQQDQSEIEHQLTERRQTEEALRFSDAAFKSIHESVIAVDNKNIITYWNHTSEQLFGIKASEAIGKKIVNVIKSVEQYPGHGEERLKKLKDRGYNRDELLYPTKHGEVWVDMTVQVIEKDQKRYGFVLTALDITKRKKMEEALQESEEKLRRTFESTTEAIVILDMNGNFVDMNEAALRMHGYNRKEELIGGKSNILIAERDRNRAIKSWHKILAEGSGKIDEYIGLRKDGSEFNLEINRTTLRDSSGNLIGIVSIGRDITERKQTEEKLKQALSDVEKSSAQMAATNKELEAFSYSVSHDLRSPLRSIDGFSQALLEDYSGILDESGRDYLRRLRGASQKMGELIDGLLKLSRLSRSEMRKEQLDLSALAKEIAARLQETQPKRQAEFVISKGLTTNGDRQLLRVLLENLLGNAWKFTSKSQQTRIEFGTTQNGDKKAYFIRDNGAGFDMTYADKLFGAFQRLHDTTEFPGTGIGLATVQRIIHRHGGSVWAEGEVGKGATFYFTLN